MKSESNTRAGLWIDLLQWRQHLSWPLLVAGLLALSLNATARDGEPEARAANQVAGTWRMVSATLETDGGVEHP
jgi:hypothetical protein